MSFHRTMLLGASLALVAGLFLVLGADDGTGWFTYAPESDGEHFAITGGTILSDQQMLGFALIGAFLMTGAGLLGYRLGTRRES